MTRVGVFGAGGRMGTTVCQAVLDAPGLELVAAVDPLHAGIDLGQLGVHGTTCRCRRARPRCATRARRSPSTSPCSTRRARTSSGAPSNGVHAVVGTTGFSDAELADFAERFDRSAANAVIAPNFAIGAILMMRFAEMAAPYFETAEIIELHHDQKIDAPSGTAVLTAQRMAAASKDWSDDPTHDGGGRRAPAAVWSTASRCTRCACAGWSRTKRCCSARPGRACRSATTRYDRSSFMPGVLLAVQKVADTPGLTIGLDALLGL